MVKTLDMNGNMVTSTITNGQCRRLLKAKKAKIIEKEPFTIQLMVPFSEIDENKEIKHMNIVVSNILDLIPEHLKQGETRIVMPAQIFYDTITPFEMPEDCTDVYINVKDIRSPEEYKNIQRYFSKYSCTCHYYYSMDHEYNYIPGIEVYPKMKRYSTSDDMNTIYYGFSGHGKGPVTTTLIYGQNCFDTGVTELISNINTQLINRGWKTKFIGVKESPERFNKTVVTAEDVAKELKDLSKEMILRFKDMEKEQVNSASKLVNPPPYIALLIDDIDKAMAYNVDKEVIKSIQESLSQISRLGRAACIKLVISTKSLDPEIITIDFRNNCQNKVIVGKYNQAISMDFFDEYYDVIPLSHGIGVCSYGKDLCTFVIDDVKNYE